MISGYFKHALHRMKWPRSSWICSINFALVSFSDSVENCIVADAVAFAVVVAVAVAVTDMTKRRWKMSAQFHIDKKHRSEMTFTAAIIVQSASCQTCGRCSSIIGKIARRRNWNWNCHYNWPVAFCKKSSRRHISPTFNNLFSNYVSAPSLFANCNESISQFVGFESAISPSSAISEGNKKPKSKWRVRDFKSNKSDEKSGAFLIVPEAVGSNGFASISA